MPAKACHVPTAMRPFLIHLLACAAISACAVVSAPGSARATTAVARCAMPDGTFAYTDLACSSLGGRHVALPADVQNRIRRERQREARLTGTILPPQGLLAKPGAGGTPRRKAQGCATTPRQLAGDLRASMAEGDVNRIAGNFDWAGVSHGRAMQMMSRIERLAGVSLVDAEYFGAMVAGGPGAAGNGTLQVVLHEPGMQKVADFDVRRRGECYLLDHRWTV